jgi:hypothetical protein
VTGTSKGGFTGRVRVTRGRVSRSGVTEGWWERVRARSARGGTRDGVWCRPGEGPGIYRAEGIGRGGAKRPPKEPVTVWCRPGEGPGEGARRGA